MTKNDKYEHHQGGNRMNISSKYVEEAIRILREIEATQEDKIETVAQLFAASIADDGLVHVYGS
ncbi:MAG: SIS domain-containing protein, partial [Erysipelotrichaceae bacterium]|nr:SIS domain-containing protein [Erysipelotrichaceae bacterium]